MSQKSTPTTSSAHSQRSAPSPPALEVDREQVIEYRKLIVANLQKAQEDFDKTVIALSGGALGVSFAFVKDILGSKPIQAPTWLLVAWSFWGLSLTCVLVSFYCSHLSLRTVIRQIDEDQLYQQRPGGIWTILTEALNALGGLGFLVGLLFLVLFAFHNVG